MPKKGVHDYIAITDLFAKHYPYPCYDVTSSTVPRPYIQKDKINCEHKRSLTSRQFSMIIQIYIKYVLLYLLSGSRLILPSSLGFIILRKIKTRPNSLIDFQHYMKTGEKRFYTNRHTMGYRPLFKWKRKHKHTRLHTRWLWKAMPTQNFWKTVSSTFLKDGSKINRLEG